MPIAHAAFQYAVERGWVRTSYAPLVAAIHVLPQPLDAAEAVNPLHDSEEIDATWYVVYRGITPGVYRTQ